MEFMKAVVTTAFGGPEVLSYKDLPVPIPKDNELLVKVYACALNPLDYKIRNGSITMGKTPSFILGYDISGVVVQVGKNVTRFKPGDEVYYCAEFTGDGGYAEYHVVREDVVALKPENITYIEAASLPLAGMTAWESLFTCANIKEGENVLIHAGAGGVGSIAIQLARWKGAKIYTTISSPGNYEFVKELGANVIINYKKEDFVKVINSDTKGKGVEVILDSVGEETLLKSLDALSRFGRIVTIVNTNQPLPLLNAWFKNAAIHFLLMEIRADILNKIRDLVENDIIRPSVRQVFTLKDVVEAHKLLETHHVQGKIVLEVCK
jgi:NADPH:quinone reductase-like Zn-dependent oxidoreductase